MSAAFSNELTEPFCPPGAKAPALPGWKTATTCAALLIAFYAMSWFAVQSKSPTMDEPLHLLSSDLNGRHHDYRVDMEDPALFTWLASLPNANRPLALDTQSRFWRRLPFDNWMFVIWTWYATPGNDIEASLSRVRMLMPIIGVLLGALIAWWSWRLAGAAAGIVSTVVFCFDPTFLGHTPLLKNDVLLTLATTAMAALVWSIGRSATVARVLALAAAAGAAVNLKFSGVMALPLVAILLLLRALLTSPWPAAGVLIVNRSRKLAAALVIFSVTLAAAWGLTWACYGFRFDPTPDPAVRFDVPQLHNALAAVTLKAQALSQGREPTEPTRQQLEGWKPGVFIRTWYWLMRHRLLPEAWVAGFLVSYGNTLARPAFLMGRYSQSGWWYYFPLAMLFKSPISTIAAAAMAGVVIAKRSLGPSCRRQIDSSNLWTAICLALPPALYGAAAMHGHINIGVRHMLPVYPFIAIAIGCAAAMALRTWPRVARVVITLFALVLATESLSAFPNYIAFFNTGVGGSRGGLQLLGDSNLDWGQDLKLLALWQEHHSATKLYLMTQGFTSVDPGFYGIRYTNLPGGFWFGSKTEKPAAPGVIAIGATQLQGIYLGPTLRAVYQRLTKLQPDESLGGSIYLYRFPQPGFDEHAFDDVNLNSNAQPPADLR